MFDNFILLLLLLLAMYVYRLCEVMELNPVQILMCMIIYSNIGGAITPVGDRSFYTADEINHSVCLLTNDLATWAHVDKGDTCKYSFINATSFTECQMCMDSSVLLYSI